MFTMTSSAFGMSEFRSSTGDFWSRAVGGGGRISGRCVHLAYPGLALTDAQIDDLFREAAKL